MQGNRAQHCPGAQRCHADGVEVWEARRSHIRLYTDEVKHVRCIPASSSCDTTEDLLHIAAAAMHKPHAASTEVQVHHLGLTAEPGKPAGCSQHTAICMQVHVVAHLDAGRVGHQNA